MVPKPDIPQDPTLLPGMKTIMADPAQNSHVYYLKDIEYLRHGEQPLYIQMLRPFSADPGQMKREKRPLIVYIQGSAWMKQNCYLSLPLLCPVARKGYIIASVEYRSAETAPFPGAIQDVKAAVRFLRAHAEDYGIDPERIAAWGDSSGGHTAVMLGLTGDMPEFRTDLYRAQSDAVSAVIDFYGPTDVTKINDAPRNPVYTADPDHIPENILFRGNVREHPDISQPGNPLNYVLKEKKLPPFFIAHGDWDDMVPFNQSVLLYQKLLDCGKPAEFCKVAGAGHGTAFWTDELLELTGKFIRAYL